MYIKLYNGYASNGIVSKMEMFFVIYMYVYFINIMI